MGNSLGKSFGCGCRSEDTVVCGHQLSPLQFYEGTAAKLRQAFQAMGRPDALKVVDRCLEEQHSSVQTLNVAGGRPVPRPRVRTAPGKDNVQWSCVPHTSCASPSLSVWRYCSASWPAGLWSGIRTVWTSGYWYVGMAA